MRALMILAAGAALASLSMAGPTAAAPKKPGRGDTVMFNPQPDPPGVYSKARLDVRTGRLVSDELNPQPLPPGPPDRNRKLTGGRFGSVELNPQPEPPGRR